MRRKLIEAEPDYPETQEALDLIGKLYHVESKAKEAGDENRLAVLDELRQSESKDIVDEIRQWMNSQRVLPKSALGKAITYADSLWPGLKLFLTDLRIPIDNNGAEREIRPVVLGRKNHYGSRSRRGTKVASLFYSLIEAAQLSGLDPAEYLAEATRRAIDSPGTVTLPADFTTEQDDKDRPQPDPLHHPKANSCSSCFARRGRTKTYERTLSFRACQELERGDSGCPRLLHG